MEKPYTSFSVLVFLVAIGITTISVDSGKVQRDRNRVIHRTEDISGDGRYILEWEVNFDTEIITFEVTVETIGFVGFGISPFGGMLQADIVVGGVFPNGTTYFTVPSGIQYSISFDLCNLCVFGALYRIVMAVEPPACHGKMPNRIGRW